MTQRWQTRTALALSAALLSACGSTMINPVTGEAERSVMTEEQEITEGAKGHQEVLKEYCRPTSTDWGKGWRSSRTAPT
jgi:hypothetical protein